MEVSEIRGTLSGSSLEGKSYDLGVFIWSLLFLHGLGFRV